MKFFCLPGKRKFPHPSVEDILLLKSNLCLQVGEVGRIWRLW